MNGSSAKMPVGAVLVSVLVVAGFYGMIWLRFSHPEVKDDSNLTLMFGAMVASFTAVVNYWIGSSRSSATKDDAMQATASKLADSATSTITHVGDDGKVAVRVTEAKQPESKMTPSGRG